MAQVGLDTDKKEDAAQSPNGNTRSRSRLQSKASDELYHHEIFALGSCLLFPALGAYLLHAIRTQLSRPSEGLVSNFNLTVFLLASEVRPLAHLVKLVQKRTLHLQRIVNENPYNEDTVAPLTLLSKKIEELEARLVAQTQPPTPGTPLSPVEKGNTVDTESTITSVRASLQPDLDALNRAVRRYEKRATLQTMQTEARLIDLDNRMADALTLAAAGSRQTLGGQRQSFSGILFEWACALVVLPIQVGWGVVTFPKTVITRIWRSWEKKDAKGRRGDRYAGNGHGKMLGGDRVQARGIKRM
jgi:hypothetical protein